MDADDSAATPAPGSTAESSAAAAGTGSSAHFDTTAVLPAAQVPHGWRPQAFAKGRAANVADPIIEPLWEDERVLVHVNADGARLFDADGDAIDDFPDINTALVEAALASELVVDGYLSRLAAKSSEGAFTGTVRTPTVGEMATQFVIGQRSTKRVERAEQQAAMPGPDAPVAFVAVDILSIDDQSLLSVPLLERKRVLESALAENALVRLTMFIRPPVGTWFGSWRSLGFRSVAFKGANSRYRPGEPNPDWVIAQIPQR
jgi:ATP-dependent DNA ligase